MPSEDRILVLEDIVKTYDGVVALNGVSLDVRRGEIHALVGENGAGKSTLIKTCTGAVTPDSGSIAVGGETHSRMTPALAQQNGIAVIYQEFNLVEELTVAENVFLGNAIRKGMLVDFKAMRRQAAEIFERLNVHISPDALVKDLSVGYQQIVEIAKAVSQEAKILIMDEPSAPLTESEVDAMLEMVKQLQKQGVSIVYISHRLPEIFHISDRVTVLRDGQRIQTMATEETDMNKLIRLMVGRDLNETFPQRESMAQEETLLEIRGLWGNGLQDVSLEVKRGEILGLAGLIGAGRTELAELIFGVKKPEQGEILFKKRPIQGRATRRVIDEGIALVPEDRKRMGLLLQLCIRENISLPGLRRISRLSVVSREKEKEITGAYKESLRIVTPSMEQITSNLSGGNQQKVVLAKWLAMEPELLIFDEPTRGIDVGTKYEIYKIMKELVENGKTIIMISSEMEELMGMADRIVVLCEGQVTGEMQRQEFDQELILAYASNVADGGRNL